MKRYSEVCVEEGYQPLIVTTLSGCNKDMEDGRTAGLWEEN